MTDDDAAGLTAILHDFGGLWVISKTPQGYVAQRRPRPAPPLVLTAETVSGLREQLEHGYDAGKLAEVRGDFGKWGIERLDPGTAWVAVCSDGGQLRVIAADDLDSLRGKLAAGLGGTPGKAT